LKEIFLILSLSLNETQKSFNIFNFTNKAIKKIESNTFYDINFKIIIFERPTSLERIHTNAFASCIHTLQRFEYNLNNRDNTSEGLISDSPDYNILEILSSFVNAEFIVFSNKALTSIPDYAFQPVNGPQNKLKTLDLCCGYSLSKIGKNAFYDLINLEGLDFYYQNISHIQWNSFWFRHSSNKELQLDLSRNKLNSSSFEIGSFTNAKRPLYIDLSFNHITYLDENVFSPFLLGLNFENSINLYKNPLNCSDCRNQWIINDKLKLGTKMLNSGCQDGSSIFKVTIHTFNHCNKL
jgi:hypothetical protein